MNEYEARKAAKIDRMRARAARKVAESDGAYAGAKRIADNIPFGQPILVGHHSERRHRRDAERIHNGFGKAFALSKEAQDLERRADAAESNTAVSSDDPDAVEKLKQKLAAIEKSRVRAREINKVIRRGKSPDAIVSGLVGLGLSEANAKSLLEPDFCGRVGVPDFRLKNWGSEAKRLTKRIAELEAKASRPARPPEQFGDIEIEERDNRVVIRFPGKPPQDCRDAMKQCGFRWSPEVFGGWVRMASEGAWYWARKIAETENAKAAPVKEPAPSEPAELSQAEYEARKAAKTDRLLFGVSLDPAGSDPLEVDADGNLSLDPVGS